ncbi:MAG TPA: hypothetical protein VL500_03730 [Candidatus Eisenbacteria bacterium]|nr:hypothetical protein [Candidatus Eisenbacteria bacterium]
MTEPQEGRITGFPPKPDILWQMGKTAASIRFINEATLYLSACGKEDSAERQMLVEGIAAVKDGGRKLLKYLDVEHFLAAGRPLFWQQSQTEQSIRFVREAEQYVADGRADACASQMLAEAIAAVKSGDRVLLHPLEVDDFLVGGFPLPWEANQTEASKRFVRAAERYVADRRCGAGEAQMLGEAIAAVKNGERSLTRFLEIEDFLISGFPA